MYQIMEECYVVHQIYLPTSDVPHTNLPLFDALSKTRVWSLSFSMQCDDDRLHACRSLHCFTHMVFDGDSKILCAIYNPDL